MIGSGSEVSICIYIYIYNYTYMVVISMIETGSEFGPYLHFPLPPLFLFTFSLPPVFVFLFTFSFPPAFVFLFTFSLSPVFVFVFTFSLSPMFVFEFTFSVPPVFVVFVVVFTSSLLPVLVFVFTFSLSPVFVFVFSFSLPPVFEVFVVVSKSPLPPVLVYVFSLSLLPVSVFVFTFSFSTSSSSSLVLPCVRSINNTSIAMRIYPILIIMTELIVNENSNILLFVLAIYGWSVCKCSQLVHKIQQDVVEWTKIRICWVSVRASQPREHSGYGHSQWETTLLCNVVSHWLHPYSEWILQPLQSHIIIGKAAEMILLRNVFNLPYSYSTKIKTLSKRQ